MGCSLVGAPQGETIASYTRSDLRETPQEWGSTPHTSTLFGNIQGMDETPHHTPGLPRLAVLLKRFSWTLHNMVAHPLSEILKLGGFRRAADWVHDATVPEPDRE